MLLCKKRVYAYIACVHAFSTTQKVVTCNRSTSMEVESHVHSVSEDALARTAQTLVANAVASAFNEDPVIGPDLSRAISVVGSVVKRHGLLLQSTTANALAASGRFDVLVDVAIPIVDAAN